MDCILDFVEGERVAEEVEEGIGCLGWEERLEVEEVQVGMVGYGFGGFEGGGDGGQGFG